jgi:Tfp pilus assembly protein FimT
MIQPAQHQTSRSVGSKNMTKYLFGLTIIELLVTVALIAIMAALSISSLKRIRRPQELVDTATMVIENLLNQANSDSVTTNTTKYICNLSQNIGSGASCPATAANSTYPACPYTWNNVNGNIFLPQVNITGSTDTITYTQGLVATLAKLTITSTSNTACYNSIIIWPNGVLDVSTNTLSAGCLNN